MGVGWRGRGRGGVAWVWKMCGGCGLGVEGQQRAAPVTAPASALLHARCCRGACTQPTVEPLVGRFKRTLVTPGMYSLGTTPPLISLRNSKPVPGSPGCAAAGKRRRGRGGRQGCGLERRQAGRQRGAAQPPSAGKQASQRAAPLCAPHLKLDGHVGKLAGAAALLLVHVPNLGRLADALAVVDLQQRAAGGGGAAEGSRRGSPVSPRARSSRQPPRPGPAAGPAARAGLACPLRPLFCAAAGPRAA